MRDKRRHPRKSGGTAVRYRPLADDDNGRFVEGVVENVGLGGVFIATEDPLPQNCKVELEFFFDLDGSERTVRARAMVRWARRKFNPAGMGLQFTEFSGPGQRHLAEWIDRLQECE